MKAFYTLQYNPQYLTARFDLFSDALHDRIQSASKQVMIIKLKSPISYQFTQKNVFLFRTQCCDNKGDLQTAFLCFRSMEHELEYQRQPDTNFHYYVFCATMLFTFLSAIQFILIPRLVPQKNKDTH